MKDKPSLFPKENKVKFNAMLARERPGFYYRLLRKQGLAIGFALWCVVKERINFKWHELHDEFEMHGKLTYLSLTLQGQSFHIVEYDGDIYFNNIHVYSWTEKDVYDAATAARIRKTLKQFILNSQYQFGLK